MNQRTVASILRTQAPTLKLGDLVICETEVDGVFELAKVVEIEEVDQVCEVSFRGRARGPYPRRRP